MDTAGLAQGVLAGQVRSIARAISLVESGRAERDQLLDELRRRDDPPGEEQSIGAAVIGITGPPGAGKSTLISRLIMSVRETGEKVAVLAVDPSSPFTGGALLGDRIRMDLHGTDPGVFIRSMASRGGTGGISAAALETVQVLVSAGYGTIIVESVGVGQSEVGILTLADIVLVALTPGSGDEIQALKAGVMEIGDLYVVNKADYPQAEAMVASLNAALEETLRGGLAPLVLRTVATEGTGVAELYRAIGERLDQLHRTGELERRRQQRVIDALREMATDLFSRWISERLSADGDAVSRGIPFAAMRQELEQFLEQFTWRNHNGQRND